MPKSASGRMAWAKRNSDARRVANARARPMLKKASPYTKKTATMFRTKKAEIGFIILEIDHS